jgi:hypothetical protein
MECWEFIKEESPSSPYNDIGTPPEVYAAKAAMRLLYPDPDNSDIIDIVGYFLKMANGFEDHSEEVEPLLREYFS